MLDPPLLSYVAFSPTKTSTSGGGGTFVNVRKYCLKRQVYLTEAQQTTCKKNLNTERGGGG